MRACGSFLLPLVLSVVSCVTRKPVPAASAAFDTASLRQQFYEAELQFQSGNWQQADSLFRRFASKPYRPAPAYYRLACIAAQNGKLQQALAWNAKAKAADTSLLDAELLDAEIFERTNQYKLAGDVYARRVKTRKRAWTCYTDAARCYGYGRNWDELLDLCQNWENEFGLMENIAAYQSMAYSGVGDFNAAAASWERLNRKYPDRRQYRQKQFEVLMAAGEKKRAGLLLDSMLLAYPNNPELLALSCERMDNAPISQYVKIAATPGITFQAKWKCLSKFDNPMHRLYDSCEPLFKELATVHANEPLALQVAGRWFLKQGKSAAAAHYLRKALNYGPSDMQLYGSYLYALSMGCQADLLQLTCDTLQELYPMGHLSFAYTAWAHLLGGRFVLALQSCETAARITYDESTVNELAALKAVINMRSGNKPDASFKPLTNWQEAQNPWQVLASVEWYLLANDFTSASTGMEFGERKTIDYPLWPMLQSEWMLLQGRIALASGEKVEETASRLLKSMPENPAVQELAGDLYLILTKKDPKYQDMALKQYLEALTCKQNYRGPELVRKINPIKNR
jgi:Flp pilus assembly protein TadD